MAFAGQIILSSSPSRVATPRRRSNSPVSSSPLLPSPSQLIATKFANVKGAEVRDEKSTDLNWAKVGATTTTNPVAALDNLREAVNGIDEGLEDRKSVGALKRKKAKPKMLEARAEERKTSPKKSAACQTAAQKRSKSAIFAKNSESSNQKDISAEQDVEEKSIKKIKRKSQSRIEGRRITKPGLTRVIVAKKGKSTSSTKKSPQNNIAPIDSLKEKTNTLPAEKAPLDLLLAEAVRRRKAWTPPKDTPLEALNLGKLGRELNESLSLEEEGLKKSLSGGFENLLDDFGYASKREGLLISSDHGRNTNGEAVTKRRKLELVNLTPSAQARKTKLLKKKPQTVTGKATAQFLPVEPGTPSLLQYLETESLNEKQEAHIEDPDPQASASSAIQRKSRPKQSTQPSSAKSKIRSKPSPVLHSPKTAMKSVTEQDLIFGTSSQLAREESPTCLRDIQQAIINSQQTCEEYGVSSTRNMTPSISCNLPERAGKTPLAGSKNLWSVASRGLDGSLLAVEVIDLLDTPKPLEKAPSTSIPEVNLTSNIQGTKGCAAETGPSNVPPTRPLQNKPNDLASGQPIPRSLAEASLRNRRQSRSPVKKQKIPKDSGKPRAKEMPNYHGFTDADLCKEIASFGFKAIKKRSEMIALLERCWESQVRIALQTLQPNLKAANMGASREDQSKQRKPSKRKGKLQESTTAGATSNVTASPPKPRGRPRKMPASPHPPPPQPVLVPCLAPRIPNTVSSLKTDLYTQITNAINAAPATHSATHPTFRERMLLYDPIVLEDLTAWLNTEGLGMVGIDDEVSIWIVKEWCERESVCCHSRNESSTARR